MNNPIISNRFTETYNVKFPFAAAGMAFVGSTPDLAIAVCNAGGIGSIAVGPLHAEIARFLVREVRKATIKPLNVNFITHLVDEKKIRMCIEEQVPIVSFHWGHPPKKFIDLLHHANIKIWEQVGTVDDAKRAVDDGIDLVIAQGTEAGGHNFSALPSSVLLPEIVAKVKPAFVLASGGIATGKQVAAALCLGADGVWVGTRLIASNEAFAHPDYKARLLSANGTDTCLSSVFGPESPQYNPMRVIKNAVVKEFYKKETAVASTTIKQVIGKTFMLGEQHILKRFSNYTPMPATEGNFEEMPLLAGQGVGLVNEIRPAREIITTMMDEAVQTLAALYDKCKR
jgi:NAD(P)H-dependent flavin oxidoreductase YrpB (nitropropane dioxygenase family)